MATRPFCSIHVLPAWRDWRLRDIERLAIQQWVADKFRQGTGWQTVRNAWVLLSSILETAVEYGYLQANPARGVKFPQKGLKEKPAIIAGDSLAKLLKQVDEPYRTMVSLIAATGLRIGELLALRWSALDLEGGTLGGARIGVRGQVPAAEDAEGGADDSARAACGRGAQVASGARARRSGQRISCSAIASGDPLRESKLLTQRAAAGSGSGRARTGDVASVPPHSLVAAERPQGAGRRSRRSSLGTRASRRRSTSTRTSSMRRIARPSRRSKSGCSARWTVLD